MREVMLWAQTRGEAEVFFRFWDLQSPDTVYQTETVRTTDDNYFIAKIKAAPLEPGRHYGYALYINGQPVERPYKLEFQSQPLWQWRTDPPAFSFAFGSCFYVNEKKYDRPNNTYGGQFEIMQSILDKDPDFMVWGGDNVYLREADWNSETGIRHRYTHDRSLPVLQPLLGSVHHYAIWDDHDYGPNDSDAGFWNKNLTEKAFNLFWANPNTNLTGEGGITGTFQWADCQFFLLDDRWFRSPDRYEGPDKTMFGEAQINWLLDALTTSNAPFKFVVTGGQILNSAAVYETYATFPEARQKLLERIRERDIPGVIFLTGDRHHTELSKMEREETYPLYDLTISPFTSGTHTLRDEGNLYQVPGTLVGERNFAILTVDGPRTARVLHIHVYGVNGQELWHYEIPAGSLR